MNDKSRQSNLSPSRELQDKAARQRRSLRGWALAWIGLVSGVSTVSADVLPTFVTVSPADALNGLVLAPLDPTPAPASINTIRIANSSNSPITGGAIEVILLADNVVCGETILSGLSDEFGEFTFTLGGGGCSHNQSLAGLIKVNGVTFRNYENVKSPDFDGAGGDLVVNLSDLVDFSNEFLGSAPSDCHDYDNNSSTDLSDLIIFSPTFVNPNSCAP